MHANCLRIAQGFADLYGDEFRGGRILEVGSYYINGSAREIFEPLAIEYVGIDLQPGPGVDYVFDAEKPLPTPGLFDAAICLNTLEHSRRPWRVVLSIAEALRPGGLVLIVAPWQWAEHRWPIDCWRILPDGMRVLFEDAGMEVLIACTDENDCIGVGRQG